MDWFISLFTTQNSVAHIALLFSIVIATGISLGKIKIGGISLGVTFVLFTGIIAGHIGFTAPTDILDFCKRFRSDFICILHRSAGWPGIFREFQKGRDHLEHSLQHDDSFEHLSDVRMLLPVF
jgi:putative transport protein